MNMLAVAAWARYAFANKLSEHEIDNLASMPSLLPQDVFCP